MEMMVWALRRDGAKIARDELGPPTRGWLRMESGNVAGVVSLHASLHASASRGAPAIMTGLTEVTVKRLDQRGLLLYGLQSTDPGSPVAPKLPQAWWCTPVTAAPGG